MILALGVEMRPANEALQAPTKGVLKSRAIVSAAQQVAGADQAIESFFEVCVAFGAFWFTVGFTAPAAWQLSSNPLAQPYLKTGLGLL